MKKLKTISEQVYDYVIEKIMNGELTPGQKITETDLLQELDISRTPIRDAFLQLVSDGVLVSAPRKGYFVREYDEETAMLDWKIIARLDIYAAELAINALTESDYDIMQNLIGEMDAAIDAGDTMRYNDIQHQFHDVYLNKCGNRRLVELLHSLIYGSPRASVFLSMMNGIEVTTKELNEQHQTILDTFRKKDLAALSEALYLHWVESPYTFDPERNKTK